MRHVIFLYTDPGTGTLIIQLLIAAFFGALFYIRFFVRRAQGFFTRKKKTEDNLESATTSETRLPESSNSITKEVD